MCKFTDGILLIYCGVTGEKGDATYQVKFCFSFLNDAKS